MMLGLCGLFVSPVFAAEPSSEIPARREFPVSPEIKPCEDFHAYVCSKAEASFKLRDDRSHHVFSFSDSSERILEFKKKFMTNIDKDTDLEPRSKQIRDFYLACMNEKAGAATEKKEVAKRVSELKAVKTPADLIQLNNKSRPEALGNLYSFFPSANLDDPKKQDVIAMANFMLLPDHKYYENPELMKDYEKLLTLFFKNAYAGLSDAEALKKAQASISLQKDFAKVYPIANIRRQRWAEKRVSTQAEFLKKYPQLQAETYFKFIPNETVVNTPIPEALDFLNTNLTKYPLEVWKDVYLAKNVEDIMDDGFPAYFKASFEFEKKYFGGPEVRSVRQERCTEQVAGYFLKELDSDVVQKIFPNFDDAKFDALAQTIRGSIVKGLENNTWLSKEGKAGAIMKIKNARLQLVRPRTDREWDFNIQRTYSARDKIANLHKYRGARWEKSLKEVKEPTNQDAWGMGPLTVNAYYSENENKFVMPIGILQYPFYDQSNLDIENLGAVGSVIGHELGHSVDDQGSKYDYEGKLKTWMPMKDIANFDERSRRMTDQFNKAGFDGKLTLGENTADLVGLTFAHQAAFPNSKGSKEDEQKFFVAYARTWCSVTRPDYAKLLLKTDPHAAGTARINEQVKQQAAFAEAFECKKGDKMTLPEKERVKIW
jgi:putative endopeptidase